MGPTISDKTGRLLERCLGSPLDEKVIKQKRDAFLRPENISNLKVPRTNPIIFNKASTAYQNLDSCLQLAQSYLIGGMVGLGRQAEKLSGLRFSAAGLGESEKENLPEEISKLTTMYVELMDSLILFVRIMSDLTNIRRKMFKTDLVEPYKSLMEDDKNPPSPDWLGRDDVHAAIRKAKANAFAAEDLIRKNKWPKKLFNKNRNSKPYDNTPRRQYSDDRNGGGYKQQNRKSDGYRRNDSNRKDFRRRDSH